MTSHSSTPRLPGLLAKPETTLQLGLARFRLLVGWLGESLASWRTSPGPGACPGTGPLVSGQACLALSLLATSRFRFSRCLSGFWLVSQACLALAGSTNFPIPVDIPASNEHIAITNPSFPSQRKSEAGNNLNKAGLPDWAAVSSSPASEDEQSSPEKRKPL